MNNIDIEKDMRYLQLLSHNFPTVASAATELINLTAILNLPKSTEHFLADIHGEHQAFQHILKNASGNIKRKVNDIFGSSIRKQDKKDLCTLIYYPEQKLELIINTEENLNDWYHITLHRLIAVLRDVSSKYTRSKVNKNLPESYSYIIQELLHEQIDAKNKTAYVNAIIDTIIETQRVESFIVAICNVIQRLAIDQLHILGDIYDRGPGAHIIMDTLANYHSWDIQWGNHDILWMGAGAGNDVCICNVLRICLRYANLTTLQEGYGIDLVPLATFAMEHYKDDPCTGFEPKVIDSNTVFDEKQRRLATMMHKAIAILQLKLEGQMIQRHPTWHMGDRDIISTINLERNTCVVEGKEYEMQNATFPTGLTLTTEEIELMQRLHHSFRVNEKLQNHIRLILRHGCMYATINNNLLFHASIPLNDDGSLKEVEIVPGKFYSGKELMHKIGMLVRSAFQNDTTIEERQYARDYFMYLWCGPDSPLFDKSKMSTFERYFVIDKATHKEEKGNYFKMRENEKVIDGILEAFGLTGPNCHIINGHVPVHVNRGENPIKANGKLMVIDGGFSAAYHKETGIAGYTLVYHSRGFQLVSHEPFTSAEDAVRTGADIKSTTEVIEMSDHRMLVADTDKGREIKQQIQDLSHLLYAYRHGYIKEREIKAKKH